MNNTATNHNTTSRFTRFCAFALAHIVTLLPLTASAIIGGGGDDKTCGRYTYTTFGNEATITEFDDYEYEGDLVITNELDGYTVTSIGWNAFKYCDNLTAVTIPVTVTSIGDWAFQGCTSLATITIPNSVEMIGDAVFEGCSSLTNISVATDNPNYASVNGVLFNNECTTLLACPNGLSGAYIIPDDITTIDDKAFKRCAALTSIAIPNSVTTMGYDALTGCTALTNITVAVGNPNYASVDGVLFDKDRTKLLMFPTGRAGAYAIPVGVTNIVADAFCDNAVLTNITIPDTVMAIGHSAFNGCTALTSIIVPGSVKSLGSHTFGNCTSLTSVLFTGNAPSDYTLGAFADTTSTIYYLPGTKFWEAEFSGCPTVCWNPAFSTNFPPQIDASGAFGFTLTGNTNIPVRVEACDNLASPLWITVTNATLSGGALGFTDPDTATYPTRFYRFTFPH